MVNKKLTPEDEEQIYAEWIAGKSLKAITENFPVVISTVQRVIKKKNRVDGYTKNYAISTAFKHLKNINEPLELAKTLDLNNCSLHEIQKEYLLENLNKISTNIDILTKNIENISIVK